MEKILNKIFIKNITDFEIDNTIDKILNITTTKSEEHELYKNGHLIKIYVNNKKIGHARFFEAGDCSNLPTLAYWCGYAKVPNDWKKACANEFTPNKYDHIYKIQEITYTNNDVIGWDHGHLHDELVYTNLNGTVKEIVSTWLLCKNNRFNKNDLLQIKNIKTK